ncbi:CHAD domain-containing protein [Corticibacter populi]|uniref:CHAD domain-containing protein n=1 Tax=Corticibacter populi TaxID=1550736 RepID=A0A3M6QK20_9BURK|nr:CYTH and CHAD domain-containing protein [Corticibacter populi]RMX03454.1 CHAD domain-containing protein [Corticibacter populi]RZS29891.1 adenylate cyclase [Corticibacter populi]
MANTEIEFKFCIPPEQHKAVEAAVRRGSVERTRLQARYFDTASSVLARHGIALRLRKEGSRWVQTVKAAGEGSLQRLEHNVDLGVACSGAQPEPDPSLHADTPAGQLLLKTLSGTDEPLGLTYETDIWRLTRLLRIPGGWVELALDQGWIRAQSPEGGRRRRAPVLELELELVKGELAGLTALAQRWASRHGLWLSTVSKAEQGERLRAGITRVPAVKAEPTRFASRNPGGREIVQAAVASCLAQILPNASEIAAGSDDAEQIHQLRIGIRRLRTALRELAPLAPQAIDPGWQAPLVAVFRALGELRDRDEVLEATRAQLLAAGGPPVALPPASGGPGAQAIVRHAAFQSALAGLAGFAAESIAADSVSEPQGGDATGLDADAAMALLRQRLARLHARSVRAGKRFAKLAPQERHAARKRLKRLRYLGEFVGGLFDRSQSARYLARLRPVQDALGHYNDEVVALQVWRELCDTQPQAWFGVGWLSARQPQLVRDCADSLRSLSEVPRFWSR